MRILKKLIASCLRLENNSSKQDADINFDAKILQNSGWFQGVIFEVESKDWDIKPGLYIILSQSCDLLHSDLEIEPWAEIIEIQQVDSCKDGIQYGKSTRELVFSCIAGEFWKVRSITGRRLLSRDLLHQLTPKTRVDDLRNFSSWIGRRYDRVAFPNNFNNLFPNARSGDAKKAYNKFVAFTKKYDEHILEIWLKLSSWEELPSDQEYTLDIAVILKSDLELNSISDEFEKLIEGIPTAKSKDGVVNQKGLRGCLTGININEYNVLLAHQFTRADMDHYSLFNLDYISHASGSNIPPFR